MRNTRLDNCIAFIGRKNSGKTTLVEALISELTARGISASSLKHHSHDDFEIDIPGKDSYRHHAAGTVATAIVSSKRFALIEETATESENAKEQCLRSIALLPASNIILIEGFKQAGIASVELFRQDNPNDQEAAAAFVNGVDNLAFVPFPLPEAVVTDMPEVERAAIRAGLPCFGFCDISQITTWLIDTYAKPLLSVVIQSGGESRRMKQSKALVPFHGRPLIEYMVGRLAPFASELIVTTNEPEKLAYLELCYPGLRLAPDKYDKRGALPGFITALEAASNQNVAVVACDLVNAPVDLIAHEAELLEESQQTSLFMPFDAVVPLTNEGFEPFCGVYRKDACLEAALTCWNKRKERMKNVIDMLNVHIIDAASDPLCTPGCFTNVNTPEDLARAEGQSA